MAIVRLEELGKLKKYLGIYTFFSCIFVYICVHLFTCAIVYVFIYSSVYLFTYIFIYLCIYMFINLPANLFTLLGTYFLILSLFHCKCFR
jgi:hypothetical protein